MPALPERPRRDYAAEEEAGRQLTSAHIQLRRGLAAEAEVATRAILAVRPGDAGAWELLGDIEASRGAFAAACEAYQTARQFDPGRASAEAKFGRATLRQAEQQRQNKLGVAYAASSASLVRHADGSASKRSALWSALGSALCPGLGQIVGGQVTKGAILVGIFLLTLGMMAILPHGIGKKASISPAFWILFAISAADWVYAVADAALAGSSAVGSEKGSI